MGSFWSGWEAGVEGYSFPLPRHYLPAGPVVLFVCLFFRRVGGGGGIYFVFILFLFVLCCFVSFQKGSSFVALHCFGQELTSRGFGWSDEQGRVQHDAHELYRLLMDRLEDSLRKSRFNPELVSALYEGDLASEVRQARLLIDTGRSIRGIIGSDIHGEVSHVKGARSGCEVQALGVHWTESSPSMQPMIREGEQLRACFRRAS